MSNEQALLNCTFGWGKTCCLYYDSIEVDGRSYNLKDLTSIQPSYRTVFGVSSARLELSFGLDHLVLRGIADLDIARLMVSHLQPYCSTAPHVAHKRSRSKRSRNLARAQARAWERTNKLPAILDVSKAISLSTNTSGILKCSNATSDEPVFDEEQPTDEVLSLDAVPKAPVEDTSLTPSETLEAFAQLANNLSTYASPLPTELWQPPHTPRFQPPLHSVHLIPPDQKFDSNSIPVPVVKSSVLPIIHVPVRLQHGECAHYSIGATLCSDRISSSARATYPLLDQGLLVLTNRRVLYIGKRCQFTLAYTHLWYVSLLHTAIALHIEGQFRRIIIELEHPHEWASRIELLSFIARRARPRPEPPTISVPAIPGLNMTVKRKAIKPAAKRERMIAENATIPLLSERIVESKIVEAETIEFIDASIEACASRETVDFPPAPEAAEVLQLENAATREFPQLSDVAIMATREFSLSEQLPQKKEPRSASPSRPDVATLATREFSLQPQENAPHTAISGAPDVAQMATREFSLSAQPSQGSTSSSKPDVATMAAHKFSLSEQQDEENPQKHMDETHKREKMTQGLQLDQEEIARLREAQPPEEQPEITTSALYDPALSLAALPRNESELAERNESAAQHQDDDDDDRTIHLHDRKLSLLRTVSLRESASDKLSESELTNRRPSRTRAPQRPS